jgi:hypothetical protein
VLLAFKPGRDTSICIDASDARRAQGASETAEKHEKNAAFCTGPHQVAPGCKTDGEGFEPRRQTLGKQGFQPKAAQNPAQLALRKPYLTPT